jgi:hypothetical protein
LLSALQLTRMALVFTAVSNTLCSLLLLARMRAGPAGEYNDHLIWHRALAVALMSVGLYGFGMSLNDIIDRRRDRQLAAHRPLPSGRIGIATAHTICVLLFLLALGAVFYIASSSAAGDMTLLLFAWTATLITFYDFAGKYLVWPGLLTLGLIRFFHAVIPAPQLPLVWHPLLLLNHVTILSAACYQLEKKRPPLTRLHWWMMFGGLALADVVCVMSVWWRRQHRFAPGTFAQNLWVKPALIYPVLAGLLFIAIAILIRKRNADPRAAGQKIMLAGLLWLIVYDVSFVAGYVGIIPAALLLLFAPAAYFSIQLMRWWANLLSLSQRPAFQRAR